MITSKIENCLRDLTYQFDSRDIIRSLYEVEDDLAAKITSLIAEIVPDVPESFEQLLDWMDKSDIHDAAKLILLRAVLSLAIRPPIWVHYRVVLACESLLAMGVAEARVPLLIHALLAATTMNDAADAQRYIGDAISRHVRSISPRDAIHHGLLSLAAGNMGAIWPVQAAAAGLFGAEQDTPPATLVGIQDIARKFGILSHLEHVVVPLDAAYATVKVVQEPSRAGELKLGASSEHWVFRQLENGRQRPRISIAQIENATLSYDVSRPGSTAFYVFDAAMNCIEDISYGPAPFIDQEAQEIQGTSVLIDDIFSGTMNVCHFVADQITRIALYEKLKADFDHVFMIKEYPYFEQMAVEIGLREKFVFGQKLRGTVRFRQLLVSTNVVRDFRHPAHFGADWAIRFIRDRLLPKRIENPQRRLFVSRGDAVGRQIVNAAEVQDVFEDFGFETVTLGGTSLRAQIDLFGQAACIAAVHGAGLTNLLFAPANAAIVELLPPFSATPAYCVLSSAVGLGYFPLTCRDPELASPDMATFNGNPHLNNRNLVVDALALRSVLERAIDAQADLL